MTKIGRSKIQESKRDPKKDTHLRELAEQLRAAGVTVRREKLGAGPGWKAVSGACRVDSDALLFVDPRLPQDEQILFLSNRLAQLGQKIPSLEK